MKSLPFPSLLLLLALSCAHPTSVPADPISAPVEVAVTPVPVAPVPRVQPVLELPPPPDPLAVAQEARGRAEAERHLEADALLAKMTLEQKVGQLMMVGFSGTEVDEDIRALVAGRQVGGVCMFKRNIRDAEQIARLNDGVRRLMEGSLPPFIAVDQEGGNVVRVQDGVAVLPGNMALGATGSESLAYEAGLAQAEALKLLGFNMNLAPVLDVNLNPKNPVIGIRSFGDDAVKVAAFGRAFVRGQQQANLATVAKHFPGHGNTDADSHTHLPVMTETSAQLMEQLVPFTAAIEEGLDGLMTAHVAIPKVTGNRVPATLSESILMGLLRRRLGFDGLVLTDELEMEAIAKEYGVGRAAVMSVQAGADMVLIPWRVEKKTEVYYSLLAAVRAKEISADRLDGAVRRILRVKLRRGMFDALPPLAQRLEAYRGLNTEVAERIAQGSVTLIRADEKYFPLREGMRVGVITAESSLAQALSAKLPGVQTLVVPAYPSARIRPALREKARALALSVDVVVMGVINSRQLDLVTMAAATNRPVIVVSMGLPYLIEHVPEAKAVLALYSYQDVSAVAAAEVLLGLRGTPGRLPVTLKRYQRGHGLNLWRTAQAGPGPKTTAQRTAAP